MRRRCGASLRCATLRSWWRPHMGPVPHRRRCVASHANITRSAALRPRHHISPPRCSTGSPSVRGCAAAPTRHGAVAVAGARIRRVGGPASRRLVPTSAARCSPFPRTGVGAYSPASRRPLTPRGRQAPRGLSLEVLYQHTAAHGQRLTRVPAVRRPRKIPLDVARVRLMVVFWPPCVALTECFCQSFFTALCTADTKWWLPRSATWSACSTTARVHAASSLNAAQYLAKFTMASYAARSDLAVAGERRSSGGRAAPEKRSLRNPARSPSENRQPRRMRRPPTSGLLKNRRATMLRTV